MLTAQVIISVGRSSPLNLLEEDKEWRGVLSKGGDVYRRRSEVNQKEEIHS